MSSSQFGECPVMSARHIGSQFGSIQMLSLRFFHPDDLSISEDGVLKALRW